MDIERRRNITVMVVPILSDFDVACILRVADKSADCRVHTANVLYTELIEVAKAVNLKARFRHDVYRGRSTRFLLTQLPLYRQVQEMLLSTEELINSQMVLARLEKGCGQYVRASYEVEGSDHINVYLEFVLPRKSVLNPEDDLSEINIPTAEFASEELQARRLEKETGW
jgi:hypothetical protein